MRDLSHLPVTRDVEGNPPHDRPPSYGAILTERNAARPHLPIARDTPFRYSEAGKCATRLALRLMGLEPEPMDPAGHHVTNIGKLVHEDWQDEMVARRGEFVECEVVSDVEGIVSGRADAVDTEGDVKVVVELKTKGGFGYKMAIGERGVAEGPSYDQIVQLALNVVGNDADFGVLVMMATEAVSKGLAERKGIDDHLRYVAEWEYPREVLQPIADREVKRMRRIAEMVAAGDLPPRMVPEVTPPGAVIEDPEASRWVLRDDDGGVVDAGTLWGGQHCKHYCPMFAHCVERL